MEPTVSNFSKAQFFFGMTTTVDDISVFHGAVVFGADLTFDPLTNAPTSGTVERIELQTRNSIEGITTLGVYADFSATVDQLQMAFADTDTVWYDPSLYFTPLITPPARAATDDNVVNDTLLLDTGDVLTAQEISAIFKAKPAVPTISAIPVVKNTPSLPPLVINFDEIIVADDNEGVHSSYTEDDDVLGDLLFGIA